MAGAHGWLPSHPYLPGRDTNGQVAPRPVEGQFSALLAALPAAPATASALAQSAVFRAGFEALDAAYYWEAHELWEAVWFRLPPASAERHLLRALIQAANAGLKLRMQRPKAAARLEDLAHRALNEAFLAEAFLAAPGHLMGLRKTEVLDLIKKCANHQPL